MKKKKFYQGVNLLLAVLLLITACPFFTVCARAKQEPYEEGFCLHDAMKYAMSYATQNPSSNKIPDKKGGNCTYFVSKCLAAGGLPMDENWNDDDRKILFGVWKFTEAYSAFVNVDKLRNYLFEKKQYAIQSFPYSFDKALPALPSPGDIIQIDKDSDGKAEHSAFCVGYQKDKNGSLQLSVAQHSPNSIVSFDTLLSLYQHYGTITIYYIRMTDTSGLTEVTSQYIGKRIAIRSLEANQYVSSGTDQNITTIDAVANRSAASTWEYFEVEAGDYGEVGFRSVGNGNYLSARVDIDFSFAPVRAAYGQTYDKPQSWESFRIYEKDGIQYLQSQANGKWLQIAADQANHPLKASAKLASTWERFQLEVIPSTDLPSGSSSGSSSSGSSSQPKTVSRHFWKSDYIEGWYEGEWKNGQPNGNGKLTYDDFSDGKYYALILSTAEYKALSYEGQFSDGYRYGSGIVLFENGWKQEGTFYGAWQAGKTVFQGRLWNPGGKYYIEATLVATSASTAEWHWGNNGKWQPASK